MAHTPEILFSPFAQSHRPLSQSTAVLTAGLWAVGRPSLLCKPPLGCALKGVTFVFPAPTQQDFNFPVGWKSDIPLTARLFTGTDRSERQLVLGSPAITSWLFPKSWAQTLSGDFRDLSNSATHYSRFLNRAVRTLLPRDLNLFPPSIDLSQWLCELFSSLDTVHN